MPASARPARRGGLVSSRGRHRVAPVLHFPCGSLPVIARRTLATLTLAVPGAPALARAPALSGGMPLRVVTPFAPGGPADTIAGPIARPTSAALGRAGRAAVVRAAGVRVS